MKQIGLFKKGKRVMRRAGGKRGLSFLLVAVLLAGLLALPGLGMDEAATLAGLDGRNQVTSPGETRYYNGKGEAATQGNYAVSVNKTVTQGANENEFKVDLTVETTTDYRSVRKGLDSGVVAVVDISWSMNVCVECGLDYGGNAEYHAIFSPDHAAESRFAATKRVLVDFLVKYAQAAGDAKALVSIVAYDSAPRAATPWKNVAGMTRDALTAYVNDTSILAVPQTGGSTNTPGGLSNALSFLNRQTDLPKNRCTVISLTDGKPNWKAGDCTVPFEYQVQYAAVVRYLNDNSGSFIDSYVWKQVAQYAFAIRSLKVPLHTVLIAKNGTVDGMPVERITEYSKMISTTCYSAENYAGLDANFTEIARQMTEAMPDTVTDTLPTWFTADSGSFRGNYAPENLVYTGNTVRWTLAGGTPASTDSAGHKVYKLSYTMKLNNLAAGVPTVNKSAPVNIAAPTFSYYIYKTTDGAPATDSPLYKVNFAIPAVESYASNLTFTKVDPSGKGITKPGKTEAAIFELRVGGAGGTLLDTQYNDASGVVTFKNVPSGHAYTLVEKRAPTDFALGSKTAWQVECRWGILTTEIVDSKIQNDHDTAEKVFTVRKQWVDMTDGYKGKTVAYTITCLSGQEVIKTATGTMTYIGNKTRANDKVWEAKVTLPTKDAKNGKELSYTITEAPIPSCTASYETDATKRVLTITNEVKATIDITVNKVWVEKADAGEVVHDPVEISLYAGDAETAVATQTLASGATSVKFTGLPLYDSKNNKITYRVGEAPVSGYRLSGNTGDQTNGFTLTNTSLDATATNIPVHIHWFDDNRPELRPEKVTVRLLRQVDGAGEWAEAGRVELSKDMPLAGRTDVWAHVFEGMPQLDGANKRITYKLEQEGDVADYVTEYARDGANVVDINETYNMTSVTVRKSWVMPEDIAPQEATFTLLQDGAVYGEPYTLQTTETAHTFEDLPVYKGDSTTEKYEYTVTEGAVPGFTTKQEGATFTNTIEQKPDVIVSGKINWELRGEPKEVLPTEVIVELWANGVPAKRPDGSAVTKTVTAENGWEFEFTNAYRYKLSGTDYVSYSVREWGGGRHLRARQVHRAVPEPVR